jgi:ATP-dependent DNA helicase HFM1/MER3
MRIIGLSATLPNLADIGEWLNCSPESIHYFDDSFRPVPLQAITLVCGSMGNPYLFDRSLDNQVKDVVLRYSSGRQTLIFCSSKTNTQNLALKLRNQHVVTSGCIVNQDALKVTRRIQDDTLRSLVQEGYGYHHAGLPPDDRCILEELFLKGYIRILCSTSTLAHGVNLPARLVIVKGTYCWRGSTKGYERLGKSDVIQMLGRAGRPGFDDHGVAVIMTSSEDRDHFSNISLSADVVDSKLLSILPEGLIEVHEFLGV